MYNQSISQITQKEKLYLEDQLSQEQVCLSKCNQYLNQVQNPQVRNCIEDIRSSCEQKVNFISERLGQAGFPQNQSQRPHYY